MNLHELLKQATSLADALETVHKQYTEQLPEEQEKLKETISQMFKDPKRRPIAASLAGSIGMQELASEIFAAYQRETVDERRINYIMALGELKHEPARSVIENLIANERLKLPARYALACFKRDELE